MHKEDKQNKMLKQLMEYVGSYTSCLKVTQYIMKNPQKFVGVGELFQPTDVIVFYSICEDSQKYATNIRTNSVYNINKQEDGSWNFHADSSY
jgi:hypothetical protein